MALIDYSDSDTEVSGSEALHNLSARPHRQSPSSRKRKQEELAETLHTNKPAPPSLPSSFHSLYATNVRKSTSDDPSLHGGRKRHVPHAEGNWPTHVYLDWYPTRAESATLETALQAFQSKPYKETTTSLSSSRVHSLLQSDLGVRLPLHISLSAPLMLRTEQRGAFLKKLEDAVGSSGVRPFQVLVTGLGWVPNANNTRWFLVLRLERPDNDGLNELLAVTNCVSRDSGLEMLYADQSACEGQLPDQPPRLVQLRASRRGLNGNEYMQVPAKVPVDSTSKFHISIAWQLEEPCKGGLERIETIQSVQNLSIYCDCLKVKIGNTIRHISLPERRLSQQDPGGI